MDTNVYGVVASGLVARIVVEAVNQGDAGPLGELNITAEDRSIVGAFMKAAMHANRPGQEVFDRAYTQLIARMLQEAS